MIEKHLTTEDLTKLFSELFSNSEHCNVVRSFIINNQSMLKKQVKVGIGNITSGSTVLHILASTIDAKISFYYYLNISHGRSLNNDMDNIINCLHKMLVEAPDDEIIRISTNLNIINVEDDDGKTALNIATQNNKTKLIEIINKLSQNSRTKSRSRIRSRSRSKVNMQTISNNSLISPSHSPMEIAKIVIDKELIIADDDDDDKRVIKIKRTKGTRGYVVKKVTNKKRKNSISKSKKTSTMKG
jgi:hypothetical protein